MYNYTLYYIVLKYESLSLLYDFMTKQGKNPYAITSYHTYRNFIVCNNILHLQFYKFMTFDCIAVYNFDFLHLYT